MNNNFDLRKYLIENKVTTNSKLVKEIKLKPDTTFSGRKDIIRGLAEEFGKMRTMDDIIIGTQRKFNEEGLSLRSPKDLRKYLVDYYENLIRSLTKTGEIAIQDIGEKIDEISTRFKELFEEELELVVDGESDTAEEYLEILYGGLETPEVYEKLYYGDETEE